MSRALPSAPSRSPRARRTSSRVSPFALLTMMVTILAVTGIGCPCVRAPVNASESLRWWLFSNFGASKVCPEMLKRGMPLKLDALGPSSLGRVFPEQCNVQTNDAAHTIVMTAAGHGYAVLPLTRRVGFTFRVAVEFRPDFRLESDSTYVWGRFSQLMAPPELRIVGVENPIVNLATQTPLGSLGNVLGQGVISSEIARGFTVVRQSDGDDFTLGILSPPQKPKRAFQPGDDRTQLATDSIELGGSTREFLGPFTVDSKDSAIFVKLRVAGAAVDYTFVDKMLGDAWLANYEQALPLGPAPGVPIGFGNAVPGDATRYVAVRPGRYYVVVENRAAAPVAPLGVALPFGETKAQVSYSIEIGDKP
ncbi:MAG: hypothetical protein U0169_21670 [Polyangiaceae bacterium]